MKALAVMFMLCLGIGSVTISEGNTAQGDRKMRKALYFTHCVDCHGPDGKGNGSWPFDPPPADLTALRIQEKSDYALWKGVHDGVPNSAMGSWKWVLSDKEEAHLLTYVQSLAQ